MKPIKHTRKICNSMYILCSLYFIKKDFWTTFFVSICSLGIKKKKKPTKASEAKNKGIQISRNTHFTPCKLRTWPLALQLATRTLGERWASNAALRPHLPGIMFYLLRSAPVPVHHLRHRQPGAPVPQQRGLCGIQELTFIRKTWLNHRSEGHRKSK